MGSQQMGDAFATDNGGRVARHDKGSMERNHVFSIDPLYVFVGGSSALRPAVAQYVSTDLGDQMTVLNERPLVYTVMQAAALLGISRTLAYELVARGDLVHVRLGSRIVIPRSAIERLLDIDAPRRGTE